MKIIFLDIDGVMTSDIFDQEKERDRITDPYCLEKLKEIITETGAEIVLTSSYRFGWSYYENASFGSGKVIHREFSEAGIYIYDKTPSLFGSRVAEIKAWLADNPDAMEFVIIDDITFGWEELDPLVVKTSYREGRGLEDDHVFKAIKILNINE